MKEAENEKSTGGTRRQSQEANPLLFEVQLMMSQFIINHSLTGNPNIAGVPTGFAIEKKKAH